MGPVLDGVFNILKPPGMTSHDVVAYARRVMSVQRVGHTGTLDPGAAGVLPLCVGKATRIAEYLQVAGKRYRVETTFGVTTSTDDSSGEVTGRVDASFLDAGAVEAALAGFRGEVEQRVPALSAKKYRGVRSYEIARSGGEPRAGTVRVQVYGISLLEFVGGSCAIAVFDVYCSGGTYMRTLCSDLGRALGPGAHMSFLLRTGAGGFGIESSMTLEELAEVAGAGELEGVVVDMAEALGFMRGLRLSEEGAARLAHGRTPRAGDITAVVEPEAAGGSTLPSGGYRSPRVRLLAPDGRLAAVAREAPGEHGYSTGLILEKVLIGI